MKFFHFIILLILSNQLFSQETFPVNGVSSNFHPVYAFTNAHIIISSEKEIKRGTMLIQEDKIIEIDSLVDIPKGSIIYDLNGDLIYPSFIDLYSDYGLPKIRGKEYNYRPQYISKKNGSYHWNESIHPEVIAGDKFVIDNQKSKNYLSAGFGLVVTHQKDGIARGTGALVSLSNESEQKSMINPEVATFFSFNKGSSSQKYPTSLMGSIALIRQLFLDSEWYKNSLMNSNISFNAFIKNLKLPHFFETQTVLDYNRIYQISDEFEKDFIVLGNGKEYQLIEQLKEFNFPIILPINFPLKYNIENPEEYDIITLAKLKHWETAPFNARILHDHKIQFAFTMNKVESSKIFLENIRKSVQKGLSKKAALNALTIIPAKIINYDNLVGTLEKGKKANFLIASSDLFEDGKIYENWTNGIRNTITKKLKNIDGTYIFTSNDNGAVFDVKNLKIEQVNIEATQKTLAIKFLISNFLDSNNKDTIDHTKNINPKEIEASSSRRNGDEILFTFNKYKFSGMFFDDTIFGNFKTNIGKTYEFSMIKDPRENKINDQQLTNSDNLKSKNIDKNKNQVPLEIDSVIPEIWMPNKAYGQIEKKSPVTIIFRNATIWTNEKEGIINNADLAIHNGEIVAVGISLDENSIFPKRKTKIEEFDATNLHITCGIIDEHSHIAIQRGVNEGSQAVTAEVRIGDVINSHDINIYRQLAGGVTTAQLLHGSANPIGGQSAIIKLRWGSSAEEMKINGADGFIKFALGENVKQSNWGSAHKIRFPQTRMGVEQVFYDAFYRAKLYKESWENYNKLSYNAKRKTIPPREDLELNALVEILEEKRFITCHSYVQSEINMLMHVADSMGFKINTFTHILEGYKIAKKLKHHGAGASTFSDWWAYKYEVNDAIPHNASILNKNGVITAINSDDAEMGRRLNQEAAKAIKYGNSSQEDAWKMVTLNPAKLLHLDDQIGSVKVGKDADIVIWTDNPLSIYSKVLKTYIDGKLLYDFKENELILKRDMQEKMRIINKMISSKQSGAKQKVKRQKQILYHCDTIDE